MATPRRTPSLGVLGRIDDPAVAQQLQQILSRLATLEERLAGLTLSALGNTGAVRVNQQPIQLLRDPTYAQDAVNLRTLIRYVENRLATSDAAGGGGSGGVGGGGGGGGGGSAPTVPLPNLLNAVRDYANAHPADLLNSCLATGGSWAFMDGVVAYLQGIDARVGFNGRRGNVDDPSEDAIAYYYGVLPPVSGSNDVYVVDIIGGHCGTDPTPAWQNVTLPNVAGAWLPTR